MQATHNNDLVGSPITNAEIGTPSNSHSLSPLLSAFDSTPSPAVWMFSTGVPKTA